MITFSRATRAALVSATGLLLLSACSDNTPTSPADRARFSSAVVFGASLDDTGNACSVSPASCPPTPYFNGRASNGPLWVELVAANYGTTVTPSRNGGTNYSYLGARTGGIPGTTQGVPNMTQQVEAYLSASGAVARANTLFVLNAATVGNDINDALTQSFTNPQAPTTIIGSAVANTVAMINRLYAAGGRHILLVNSTDIGRTPLVRAQGLAAAAGATQLSMQFNAAIATQLTTLRTTLPSLNLDLLDLGALTATVLASSTSFGFTNVTLPCVSSAPPSLCTTPDSFFYWDGFHPTASAGRLVALRAIAVLDSAAAAR
ncbi:SGNH/GDSL hydrolase family protein [Gemmatimonas sp.]|uniref:SGNH/GDSL hydrolase family protein n=1 Tax=Gemmatimonas sp. TaxID=1962908 RepID=UPI00286EA32E|nr:SGNH/GDSL hydrolase family protein [Gemmatimonas sp.]